MRKLMIAAALLTALASQAQQWPQADRQTRPATRWWWLGSAVDRDNLRWSLDEYSRMGIGTVEITPIYGVKGNEARNIEFLSPQWMDMLRHVYDVAEADSINVDMDCGTGWPFGGKGIDPLKEGACCLKTRRLTVSGRGVADLSLPEKDMRRSSLSRVIAFPRGGKPQILAPAAVQKYKYGKRDTVELMAVYNSRTMMKVKRAAPGGEGYVIDHFDSAAVAGYLRRFDEAFARAGIPFPHAMFNDSYEVFGADWTPLMFEQFERRRGYKLEYKMRELLDPSLDGAKTLHDYRETLHDMILHNFTELWAAWAHGHGTTVRNQAHGSPANIIDAYAAVDIPEIEGNAIRLDGCVRGLRSDPGFTIRPSMSPNLLNLAASAAHITGKRLTSSETFTWLTEHFRTSLSQLKPVTDLMFTAGINHIFFHGTVYSPREAAWPGWRFYASVDMSPANSIWRDARGYMDYVTRCQSFLQWGQPDNDLLVYLPMHDIWHKQGKRMMVQYDGQKIGEEAPAYRDSVDRLSGMGYSFDHISDRLLLGTRADGGAIVTQAGTRYKALYVPVTANMPEETRAHIARLEAGGARVVYSAAALAPAVRPEQMRRDYGLSVIRRRNGSGQHYCIANITRGDVCAMVPLAVRFSSAMLFSPLDGSRHTARTSGDSVLVNLRSGESLILQTFDSAITPEGVEPQPLPADPYRVTDLSRRPWTLSFCESAPRVDGTFRLDSLTTWERLPGDSVRATMGTGVYETVFTVEDSSANYRINLGDVRESARVWINGKYIGCAWCVPFVLDCGKTLRRGENRLRIEVTNLPANRIADMDRRGVRWRIFEDINMSALKNSRTTNRPVDYSSWEPVPSGLHSVVLEEMP